MNIFGFTITRGRAQPSRIVYGEPLSEKEMDRNFAVPLTHPLLRSFLQLLETAEDNANRLAAEEPANREKFVGGAEQLRLVMDDVILRRERGAKLFGKVTSDQ